MSSLRYQALGPLQAGEGSRAFLGLAISADQKARPVVIIWVPDGAEKDPALLEKIRKETEHAAKLDHPHIVTVIGFASLDEGHARVVEFADGESLRKILDTCKQLPPRIATRIILDACTAVHYAHVAGNDDGVPLVHGDLRPETLLISFQGITKVTGFGALAFAPRELGGKRVKGRRVHSAPEQIISGREAISIPTDVYLLGLTLYECLTGTVPWADQAEFFDHAVLTLPLPPARPGDMPEGFEAIIQKACAKKAVDRYPTPLALREALEAAAGDSVASDEDLAVFLETLFPQSHQLRADRRHTIDAGIADFVRRQWTTSERTETVPLMQAINTPTVQVPAVPSADPKAVTDRLPPVQPLPPPPAPKTPSRSWTVEDDDDEGDKREKSTVWLIALAAVLAITAVWWGWTKANQPIPGAESPQPPVTKNTAIDAEPVVAQAEPSQDETAMADAGTTAPVDAGSAELAVQKPAVPSPPPEPVSPPAPVITAVPISIDSTPPVDLLLEGKTLGRTPWSGTLPPGKKSFTLQNKALGISVVRSVTLKQDPVNEKFAFEKGFVTVVAPDGAIIFIDGNRVGTAPVANEIPVYEGSHRILVTMGQAKWSEPFTLFGGQRVSFNVETQ